MTQLDWGVLRETQRSDRIPGAKAEVITLLDGQEFRAPFNGGWLNFADNQHTSGARQTILANTSTLLTVNGLGANTSTRFRRGIGEYVWEENTLKPTAAGEAYLIRVTAKVAKSTSNDTNVELDLQIGEGWTNIIANERKPLTKGQGVTDVLSFVFPVYCLEAFGDFGGRFYFIFSEAVTVWDKSVFIQRTFTP